MDEEKGWMVKRKAGWVRNSLVLEEALGRPLPPGSTAAMTVSFVSSPDELQRLLLNVLDVSVREGQARPGHVGEQWCGRARTGQVCSVLPFRIKSYQLMSSW